VAESFGIWEDGMVMVMVMEVLSLHGEAYMECGTDYAKILRHSSIESMSRTITRWNQIFSVIFCYIFSRGDSVSIMFLII
jgi:hypothetical protein